MCFQKMDGKDETSNEHNMWIVPCLWIVNGCKHSQTKHITPGITSSEYWSPDLSM